jgi:hypothetical protein
VDVRIIAATDANLQAQQQRGQFKLPLGTASPATKSWSRPCASGATTWRACGCTSCERTWAPRQRLIFVAQDIDLRGFTSIGVSFDWSVPFCDLGPYGATLPRVFSMVVESEEGTELLSEDLFTCAPGTTSSQALVDDEFIDISTVADRSTRQQRS